MRIRTLLLVLLLCAALVALFAVTAQRFYEMLVARREAEDAIAQAASSRQTERQAPLFDVAPAPVPSTVPFEPNSGRVDRAGLRSLLLHQRFDALNAAFDAYQDRFEAEPTEEALPIQASDAFDAAEAPLTDAIDEWLTATPNHFAPFLARAANLIALAGARRGGNYVKDTPQADLDAMHAILPEAHRDLEKALALRPRLVAARRLQIKAHRFEDSRAVRAAFDAARASCPTCVYPAVTWIYSLTPRNGGTYERMRAFAVEQAAVPGAGVLGGFEHVDRADLLVLDGRLDDALVEVNRAFPFGEHADFYEQRADIEERQKRYAIALADAEHALELWRRSDIEVDRARILINMKDWDRGGAQLLAVLRVDANAPDARSLRDFVVPHLVFEGWQSHLSGDRPRALRLLELASELKPGDPDVGRRHAWAVIGPDAGDPSAAATPTSTLAGEDAFHAAQRRDYELSRGGRYAEIVPIWDAYLAEHPNDGKAHLERGGTYFHLGRMQDARNDAQRACELGVNEGCLRAKQLQGR